MTVGMFVGGVVNISPIYTVCVCIYVHTHSRLVLAVQCMGGSILQWERTVYKINPNTGIMKWKCALKTPKGWTVV